jgi:para-nitrobenzyl esterase
VSDAGAPVNCAALLLVGKVPKCLANLVSAYYGGCVSIVAAPCGEIRGINTSGVHAFLGIPFAAPPVGDLRWRAPQPVEPWTGVLDATAPGPVAIQTIDLRPVDARAKQSEDCLYLNIWTTTVDPTALQPVMVWIHGGGFINGSGSAPMYDGAELAKRGVTVVNVNYRLGAFGFLAHPEMGTNFGLLDWVAGLEWVATNIASLGGNPNNVTVFGQSAGAAAVRALLSTPSARGLFSRAIIQSAGFEDYAVVGSPSYERSLRASERMFAELGTTDPAALRALPTEQVRLASLGNSGIFAPEGEVHTPANLTWYPVIDGDTIPTGEFEGWPSTVPVLIGTVADESRFFVRPNAVYAHPELDPNDTYTAATLATMAKTLGGAGADAILAHYSTTGLTAYEAIAELISAAVWFEPAAATIDRFAALGRDIFAYQFERLSPGSIASGLRALHSAEIAYIFGHVDAADGFDATDRLVSESIQHAWVEFARTGVPSNPDGTAWPRFDSATRRVEIIGDTSRAETREPDPVSALIATRRSQTSANQPKR